MSKPRTVSAIGMSWYTQQNYGRILDVMEDADKLPSTFENWSERAHLGESQLTAKGHVVIRAVIDADEFVVWCRARGLNVDAKARGRFASEVALRAIKDVE